MRKRMVHAKGRGFSFTYLTQGISRHLRKNKQLIRKETPFFMPLILRISASCSGREAENCFYRVGRLLLLKSDMIRKSINSLLHSNEKLILLIVFIVVNQCVMLSCNRNECCYYHLYFEENKVILKNNHGSITFPVMGMVSLSGVIEKGEMQPGSSLTMVYNDEDKTQTVLFEHCKADSSIQISITTVFKRGCVVENVGIIGECHGDIGLERDENVFVCGTPVLVGYTDKSKKTFAICPEYGELTSYYSKLEDKQYRTKTIKAGDTLFAKMVIINNNEKPIRLLCQPDGHSATFTIASHADISNSLVTRAVLWGTSDTTSEEYGRKGMLSNGIVGTLSVFSKHTEQYRESEALDVPFFIRIVNDAYKQGMEICPHTISYNPDCRLDVEKYLPFLNENYHCRNWIDHLLRTTNISSGLHSAGGDTASDYYIMDLLHQYGYQYCWSYIDTPTKKEAPDDQLWSGHFMFPRHLVYQNEKLSFPDGTCMFQYKNAWEQLGKMIVNKKYDPIRFMENVIDDCGVWTDHCYLSGDWMKLYVKDEKKREYRIVPKLEFFFEYLKDRIENGEVWNPTMSEFCDYMVKLENINVQRMSSGIYQIINDGNDSVNCSFFYKGEGFMTLNGERMSSKYVKKGKVYWGNIGVGTSYLHIISEK